ncbi:septum site-determining protein MinC [Heliophilum fasciatum]|uniref:Probable septum site-determining protein MinC n=1 Tax=Heliophilum fasciatum TaxID=35700 RepID=A0A4R2RZB8_9FIRM|nr:septum site-determining protein MinC [Heliophilum fasciatum]MCW2277136.1 septum site-determining protein MinC [Heliophilum fasciatum]TCP68227.1 septum site-determining protein MinC [Heliophilum fasciatum]
MKNPDIIIKGGKDGLTFYLDGNCDFEELARAIEHKLAAADSFLVGASVSVDVGWRQLTEEQHTIIRRLFPSYGLILRSIHTWEQPENQSEDEVIPQDHRERIYQIANQLYESKDKGEQSSVLSPRRASIIETPAVSTVPPAVTPAPLPAEAVEPDPAEDNAINTQGGDEQALVIQRTLRSGQTVRYPGHVIILGDVNPGAEVIAGGNIIVMGIFRGVAHAGAMGDDRAIVTALRLRPVQLRIANHITRPPDDDNALPDQPEVARIRDGVVTIEQYQFGPVKSIG